jgi:hypothetical protein
MHPLTTIENLIDSSAALQAAVLLSMGCVLFFIPISGALFAVSMWLGGRRVTWSWWDVLVLLAAYWVWAGLLIYDGDSTKALEKADEVLILALLTLLLPICRLVLRRKFKPATIRWWVFFLLVLAAVTEWWSLPGYGL